MTIVPATPDPGVAVAPTASTVPSTSWPWTTPSARWRSSTPTSTGSRPSTTRTATRSATRSSGASPNGSSELRDGDLACRIGGDGFVAVCHGRWLEVTLNDGRHADGLPAVRASLGVTFGAAADLRTLLRDADARLYEAKRARSSPTGASVASV